MRGARRAPAISPRHALRLPRGRVAPRQPAASRRAAAAAAAPAPAPVIPPRAPSQRRRTPSPSSAIVRRLRRRARLRQAPRSQIMSRLLVAIAIVVELRSSTSLSLCRPLLPARPGRARMPSVTSPCARARRAATRTPAPVESEPEGVRRSLQPHTDLAAASHQAPRRSIERRGHIRWRCMMAGPSPDRHRRISAAPGPASRCPARARQRHQHHRPRPRSQAGSSAREPPSPRQSGPPPLIPAALRCAGVKGTLERRSLVLLPRSRSFDAHA